MTHQSTMILLEPERVTVTTTNEDGIKTVKNTNIENIQRIFMKEQAMETELLPSQWGVVKYYRKNHYEGYVMTTPPATRKITLDLRSNHIPAELTIPVPPLVWIFEIFKNAQGEKTLTHSMIFTIKHELLSLKDKVLHAPYPNIGVNHGICWGRGNTPSVPTAKSLQNVPARFFSQPFNFDLSVNRVKLFNHVNPDTSTAEQTDSAIYHMIKLAKEFEEAKNEGKEYSYPFETLKEAGTMDVERAIRNTLPGIFS
ncbi:prokaryotic E2 ligase family D protein [Cytobacillus oceanisediminis]|uniref:prokaryotic E2 ligase family D protein n=1 Tax=Cytobacillus oceanisediminis TaxID=665099 RepID=UPI001FB4D43D|nr:prokaryotic E2 ligase family D protein [Cytobacillus oceanisediminis]UOE58131.1 hypothetical protein IRB79_26860 [Cytobacillus oceanisediminis]